VQEDSSRPSRLCRLLGNPIAFAVVELLAENKELNPSEIARAVGRSVQRVSTVLGALRLAEVVRYDSDGKSNRYRLKHLREVRSVLTSLSDFVKVAAPVTTRDR
jgi:DNA-binding transcriptional ArsR family regulator